MPTTLLDPTSELVIFFGECGKGKSSLMAHFVDEYLKTQAKQRWELSEQIIRDQNARRKKPLSFPTVPPIYSNLKLKLKTRAGNDFEPIPIEGKDIGITKEKEKYKALFPAPLIVLDEAHKEFSSKGEHLPKGQREYFMERRHYRVIMLLAAPRAVLIHKDIRDTGARCIEPRWHKHDYDAFGRICKTTWACREFLHTSDIEEYISTDGKSGDYIETTYTHNGNVYDLYDSFAFEDDFAPPEGEDFEET